MRHQYKKMDHNLGIGLLVLFAAVPAFSASGARWSRQVSYSPDLGDWIPLAKPFESPDQPEIQNKRQSHAEPRILSEPVLYRSGLYNSEFSDGAGYFSNPGARPLYLQAVPSAPQNYLTDQTGFGSQGPRLNLGQPQPLTAPHSFIAPNFNYDQRPNGPQRFPHLQTGSLPNPVKFETFQKLPAPHGGTKLFSKTPHQQPKPFRQDGQRYIDGYKLENVSNNFQYHGLKKKPQSLQKLKLDPPPKPEYFNQRNKFPEPLPQPSSKPTGERTSIEREEVQLVYVPLDTFNRGQFNIKHPVPNPQTLNTDLFSSVGIRPENINNAFLANHPPQYNQRPQQTPHQIQQDFIQQAVNAQKSSQPNLVDHFPIYPSSTMNILPPLTTPKPKKLKPHQPPLAVFMSHDSSKGESIKVSDVLTTLKTSRSISVLDTVNPNSPKVFIGPSTLRAPQNYVKFDLPYLSNLENTERKLRQLPFFVAPLSYKTPNGFAKIPFPSPHVGSVIVNAHMQENTTPISRTPAAQVYPNSYSASEILSPSTETYRAQTQNSNSPNKPTYSYFTTLPSKPTEPTPKVPSSPYQSQYFEFEPQAVTPFRPLPVDSAASISNGAQGQYFPPPLVDQRENHYFSHQQASQNNLQNDFRSTVRAPHSTERPKGHYITQQSYESTTTTTTPPPETTTLPSTTSRVTTKATSTYSNSLIDTHNPYSINQAFQFSSPFDYQGTVSQSNEFSSPEYVTRSPQVQSEKSTPENVRNPQLLDGFTPQDFMPEINHNAENESPYNPFTFSQSTPSPTPAKTYESTVSQSVPASSPESNVDNDNFQPTLNEYNDNNYDSEIKTTTTDRVTTSTTPAPTTRRAIISRGRPRYTPPRSENGEITPRTPYIRRPIRERKPATRTRYDINKITTERAVTKNRYTDDESSVTEGYKSTTKDSRPRTRGKIHHVPREDDDSIPSGNAKTKIKSDLPANDIAYQRDVLHQNYPVTLFEHGTTNEAALTTPSAVDNPSKYSPQEPTVPSTETPLKREEDILTEKPQETFADYERHVSSLSPKLNSIETESSTNSLYQPEDPQPEEKPTTIPTESDNKYVTTTQAREVSSSSQAYENLGSLVETEISTNLLNNAVRSKYDSFTEAPIRTEKDVLKVDNTIDHKVPSRKRTRQRVQTSRFQTTTEPTDTTTSLSANKRVVRPDKNRISSIQPITYRPAFDKRRTTMRIDEIEADLKTKQVHVRPSQDSGYNHPVYRPETSYSSPTTVTPEYQTTTKRLAQFRRRKPVQVHYSTTETPATTVKISKFDSHESNKINRYRGRARSSTTLKPRNDESGSSSEENTVRTVNRFSVRGRQPFNRHNHRKTSTEKSESHEEDQTYHSSINRPQFVSLDSGPDFDQWSPKLSSNSFRPMTNPNSIPDIAKSDIDFLEERDPAQGTTEGVDIITVNNEYEDVLISVTPASNKLNENVSRDLPIVPIVSIVPSSEPHSAEEKSERTLSHDAISSFESVLEAVMRNLDEQDEDEYSGNGRYGKKYEANVKIEPQEKKVSFKKDSNESSNSQVIPQEENVPTTETTSTDSLEAISSSIPPSIAEKQEKIGRGRRRGVWRKVKVRPIPKESFELAESQYYANTAMIDPQVVTESAKQSDSPKPDDYIADTEFKTQTESAEPRTQTESTQTTHIDSTEITTNNYNTAYSKEYKETSENRRDSLGEQVPKTTTIMDGDSAASTFKTVNNLLDIATPSYDSATEFEATKIATKTNIASDRNASLNANPGDMDLGTGAPDPKIMDVIYSKTPATSDNTPRPQRENQLKSVMDYLLGVNSDEDSPSAIERLEDSIAEESSTTVDQLHEAPVTIMSVVTEISSNKEAGTEFHYIPSESSVESNSETDLMDLNPPVKDVPDGFQVNTRRVSSKSSAESHPFTSKTNFFDPSTIDSTSKSTEISHETEICFRGKCFKPSVAGAL